ncbi:hypothetical protein HZS_8019, partial [Henneguya salminicola]
MSDGCVYSCESLNCTKISTIKVWKCNEKKDVKFGNLLISEKRHGNLLAFLILGEPYIFDIHDCNSAHPISSFSISSIRLGYAINRFDFLNEDIFFYEIVENYNSQESNNAKGLIFDIRQELQPTLISSHIIYLTLATAITPAESFILVNHHRQELYFSTHSGRILYSKTINNKFEIQLTYREDLSFYIYDILRKKNTSYS